ncbi:hypothetical protein ElyMa_002421400, partial [Elysia marginata]
MKKRKNRLNPKTANPATPKPITVPPEKDIFSALGKLDLAASAVLTLDSVAIRIPIFPAKAEKNAPKTKAGTMSQEVVSTNTEMKYKAIEARTTNI